MLRLDCSTVRLAWAFAQSCTRRTNLARTARPPERGMIMYALRVMSAYGILTLLSRAADQGGRLGARAVAYLLLGEVAEPLRSCWAVLLAAGLMVGARLAWGGWLINRPWR